MPPMKRSVLIIGGTDSSGGAGLTRDASVAHDLQILPMPVVTAVTAQTDDAMMHLMPVPAEMVAAQIQSAMATRPPHAIKIGMLGNAETAQAVTQALQGVDCPVVLDPVLKSTSGGDLFTGAGFDFCLNCATIITPNLPEAAALTDTPVASTDHAQHAQAVQLQQRGAQHVLIKGGHGAGVECVDTLYSGDLALRFAAPRLPKGKRGSGCSLATAIACYLAVGQSPEQACSQARQYIQNWLATP